jgi:hypothetical protein
MADFFPQSSTTSQTGHGHEANTLAVRGLIVFAVVLVAVGIFVEFCLLFVMRDFSKEENALQALAPPRFNDDSGPPRGPRLQAQPSSDLARLKEAELRRLNGYGWVNRDAGIAHIPIARAIEIVAEKGLPSSGGPAEKNPETTPAAVPNARQDRKP